MDNGRIMKELKELQEGVKNVSFTVSLKILFYVFEIIGQR
jgi:hypothetical protein